MPRMSPVTAETAPAKSRTLLQNVQKSLGMIPNVIATLGQSPAALQAYLSFNQALGSASVGAGLREQLATAIAGENACGYCASAHTALGRNAGVDAEELARNVRGESKDSKTQAALDFARSVVSKRGLIDDSELKAVRDAGYTDPEIVEIIAVVSVNVLTNYLNHIAQTEIDFPEVVVGKPVAA